MRKLKLDMDALTVESFEPADRLRGAGTVRGRESEETQEVDCETEPIPSGRDCTWNYQSCYATQCAETNPMECSDVGMCSVVNCASVGVC